MTNRSAVESTSLQADGEAGWESTHLLLGFTIGFLFLPRLHAAWLGHFWPFRALLSAAESVLCWGPQRQPGASCCLAMHRIARGSCAKVGFGLETIPISHTSNNQSHLPSWLLPK